MNQYYPHAWGLLPLPLAWSSSPPPTFDNIPFFYASLFLASELIKDLQASLLVLFSVSQTLLGNDWLLDSERYSVIIKKHKIIGYSKQNSSFHNGQKYVRPKNIEKSEKPFLVIQHSYKLILLQNICSMLLSVLFNCFLSL